MAHIQHFTSTSQKLKDPEREGVSSLSCVESLGFSREISPLTDFTPAAGKSSVISLIKGLNLFL